MFASSWDWDWCFCSYGFRSCTPDSLSLCVLYIYLLIITYNRSVRSVIACGLICLQYLEWTVTRKNSRRLLNRNFVCRLMVCSHPKWIYNKLSYNSDGAGRPSLHRSASFMFADFGTNRKPECDFLYCILSRAVFPLSHSVSQIVDFDSGCLSLTCSFSVISVIITISHILPKLDSLS